MRLLFIGDIVGRPGREATLRLLPELKLEFKPDFIVANGENLSRGKGMNSKHAEAMHGAGIDAFTSGNHIWKQNDIYPLLNELNPFILRPANYPGQNPGRGYNLMETHSGEKILVINLQGRIFMKEHIDCPFLALDHILNETHADRPDAIFVDFHAEATSEKVCLGLYAAGRVSALVGTHTHIPTADETILKGHTAYLSDVGSVRLKDSAIGIDPEPVIQEFLTQMPCKHEITFGGPVIFNAVVIDFEEGKAVRIERVMREVGF